MEPEQIDCRACGSARTEAFTFVGENPVRRCSECSHVYLGVRHTPETIKDLYKGYQSSWNDFYFDGSQAEEVVRNMD